LPDIKCHSVASNVAFLVPALLNWHLNITEYWQTCKRTYYIIWHTSPCVKTARQETCPYLRRIYIPVYWPIFKVLSWVDSIKICNKTYYAGWLKKRGHLVVRLVTLEVLARSVPNLAQINVISLLTLLRNLLKPTLEDKMTPSIEWQYTLTWACIFSAEDHALHGMSIFKFCTYFYRRAEHFHDCRWATPTSSMFSEIPTCEVLITDCMHCLSDVLSRQWN